MSHPSKKSTKPQTQDIKTPKSSNSQQDREDRLASALRANLRRRKTQKQPQGQQSQ